MRIPSFGSAPAAPLTTTYGRLCEADRLDRQAERVEWRGALYETLGEEVGSWAPGTAILAGIGVGLLGGVIPGLVTAGVVGVGALASAPLFKHLADATERKWDQLFDQAYDLREQTKQPQVEVLPPEPRHAASTLPLSYPNPRIIDADWKEV